MLSFAVYQNTTNLVAYSNIQNIFVISVSLGQESGHGTLGSSASRSLTRLSVIKVLARAEVSFEGLIWGNIHFQVYMFFWQNSFPSRPIGLTALIPSWGHPQFLTTGRPPYDCLLHKSTQDKATESVSRMEVTVSQEPGTRLSTPKGTGLHRVMNTRRWGSLGGMLEFACHSYNPLFYYLLWCSVCPIFSLWEPFTVDPCVILPHVQYFYHKKIV